MVDVGRHSVGSRMPKIPDLKWYASVSEKRGVAVRCPFATVEACPRFYQSLSLLGNAGSTKIPQAEDERLLEKWKKSDLWPRTEELATSIAGADGKRSMFSNFCPEVARRLTARSASTRESSCSNGRDSSRLACRLETAEEA